MKIQTGKDLTATRPSENLQASESPVPNRLYIFYGSLHIGKNIDPPPVRGRAGNTDGFFVTGSVARRYEGRR